MLLTAPDGTLHRFVRTFGTMTADLLGLDDWLSFHGVTHVAMESTGVLTPPPMLQIGGGRVKRGYRREWTDAEDHADLLLIDLHLTP